MRISHYDCGMLYRPEEGGYYSSEVNLLETTDEYESDIDLMTDFMSILQDLWENGDTEFILKYGDTIEPEDTKNLNYYEFFVIEEKVGSLEHFPTYE